MAGRETQLVALDDVRILVGFDADAVARAVDELSAVAGARDDRPGRGVDVLARRAHDRGLHRRSLCFEEHGVRVADLGRRRAQ